MQTAGAELLTIVKHCAAFPDGDGVDERLYFWIATSKIALVNCQYI